MNRLVGAILLISGTTIGAGMLALPMTTGLAGFIPSLILMTVIWLFMMLTAFYLVEVNLRIKGESNLISMAHKTLGRPGEMIAWAVYLLLLYSLMAAYLVGCSQLLGDFLSDSLSIDLPSWSVPLIISAIFVPFIYFGTKTTDFFNRLFMVGLILSYCALLLLGCCKINPLLLSHSSWNFLLPSISIVVTSFGYHIILPTLSSYLEHDVKLLKKAIFIGSLIPYVVYVLWQAQIMGVIPPHGENSLYTALQESVQIATFLSAFFDSPWVVAALKVFAFCAIVTSLLGVSLSLTDFLADGLKIKKTYLGKFCLLLLTFIPPLIFALFYPEGFIKALRYAGIFVVILLALLPALMTWFERYGHKKTKAFVRPIFQVPGGKGLLLFTILFSMFLLTVEIFL